MMNDTPMMDDSTVEDSAVEGNTTNSAPTTVPSPADAMNQ